MPIDSDPSDPGSASIRASNSSSFNSSRAAGPSAGRVIVGFESGSGDTDIGAALKAGHANSHTPTIQTMVFASRASVHFPPDRAPKSSGKIA